MGKKSKARREAKDAGRADLAGARERAKAQVLEKRIWEDAARDDPAILQRFDAEIGPAWVARIILPGGVIPSILAEAKAAKCLSFFVQSAARAAAPLMPEMDPSKQAHEIIDALGEGVFCLGRLAARFEADGRPHPKEEIREAMRSLLRHLHPEMIKYLKRNYWHTEIQEEFEHVVRERFAQSETPDIINAIGDAGLPKEGEPERRRPPGPRDGL